MKFPDFGRDARVNALIGCGHFLSHYYQLCLPPLFIAWQKAFDVSFAELGLAIALMGGTSAVAQAPIGFLGRSLRRAPLSDRRHQPDDAVDRGDGAGDLVLADRRAGDAVGPRQLGHPPGRLRDPERVGRQVAPRAIVRVAHLCRQYRVRRRAAGHRRADAADRLARDAAAGRRGRRSGRAGDRIAKPHPQRTEAREGRPPGRVPGRYAPAAVAADPVVFRIFHGLVDGRGRHPVLADHGIAQHPRADPRSRFLGADRLHDRGDVRHPARRLGGRPHRAPSRLCRSR